VTDPQQHDADRALDALRGAHARHDAAAPMDPVTSGGPLPRPRAQGSRAAHGSRATTSDLSVDEAILVEHAGYEPRGLVFGSAVFRSAFNPWTGMSNANMELSPLSDAVHKSRAIAMASMRNQAAGVGAAGVVGVRLEMHGSGSGIGGVRDVEFLAIGTAVAERDESATADGAGHSGARQQHHSAADQFFTSDLSGKDFYLLTLAGYRVLGMVMGVCVYHVGRQSVQAWMNTQLQNTELSIITSALYESRELAMGRMQDEALRLRANGVVGVNVEERSHVWGSHSIEFLAIGTAVALAGDAHNAVNPRLAVPLSDIGAAVDPRALHGDN
jgi:uncharacterized protein YbjQ (UPF0145 family)